MILVQFEAPLSETKYIAAGGVVVELVEHDTVDRGRIPYCVMQFACQAVRVRLVVENG